MAVQELGTPSMLRAFNERRVMDMIATDGPISRAQIARASGLSKPTVSLALSRLADQRLVREVGRTSGGRGATALLYDLEPTAGYALAFDVGRRWVRGALVDVSGEEHARHVERTRVRPGNALVNQLATMTERLVDAAGIDHREVVAATLATPGVLPAAGDADHVDLAPSLPGLGRPGVLDALRLAVGTDLRMENDVNAAALAELSYGAGRSEPDFAYVSVGTGVGCALVLDGALRRGATGSAGEIGYLPVRADAESSAATLEQVASADGLVALARTRGLRATGAEAVVTAARSGDERALAAVDGVAHALAVGIASVCAVADPAAVVLGGGLGLGTADLLLPRLERELSRLLPRHPRVLPSELTSDAVLQGAVAGTLRAARDALFGATNLRHPTALEER